MQATMRKSMNQAAELRSIADALASALERFDRLVARLPGGCAAMDNCEIERRAKRMRAQADTLETGATRAEIERIHREDFGGQPYSAMWPVELSALHREINALGGPDDTSANDLVGDALAAIEAEIAARKATTPRQYQQAEE